MDRSSRIRARRARCGARESTRSFPRRMPASPSRRARRCFAAGGRMRVRRRAPRSILLDIISSGRPIRRQARDDVPSPSRGDPERESRRALAYAQESSGLCRDDLVTQDFTWRHLFAWRRHVLSHCDRGMNRLAVADAQRVLTCDPVEGGGGATRSTRPPKPFFPTSSWSRRGELLAVAQSPPRDAR